MDTVLQPNEIARRLRWHIIVNTREKTVDADELTFDHVVRLAFDPVPSGPNIMITVSYRHAAGEKHDGTLTQGESVKIKDGTVFVVTATDKS